MKKYLLLFISMVLLSAVAFSQEIKPLYQLPEKSSSSEKITDANVFLVGSDNGLYKINQKNKAVPIWENGRVDQI